VQFITLSKTSISSKCVNRKMIKCTKCVKKQWKKGGSNFGLKTGSRGTPWNRKNAGPGGSDFTKCRFWSFKWHFGLFQGGVNFWCFFHFLHFMILAFCWFLILLIFVFCHFFCFSDFVDFCVLLILIIFCHFFMLCIYFDHFLTLN